MQKEILRKELVEQLPTTDSSTNSDAAVTAGQEILEVLLAGYDGPVAIRLWNGKLIHGKVGASCIIVCHQPSVLRHLVLNRDLVQLAESFLSGELDLEGDMVSLFDLIQHVRNLHFSWLQKWQIFHRALRLPMSRLSNSADIEDQRSTQHDNSIKSIAHHYDVSNDFYHLWLDPEMVYSCAYFRTARQSLG